VKRAEPQGRDKSRRRSEGAADESSRIPFPESTPALLQSLSAWWGRFPGVPLRYTPGAPSALRSNISWAAIKTGSNESGKPSRTPLIFVPLVLDRAAFQPEVSLGVFKADPADQVTKKPQVVRDLTPFRIRPKQIAKQTSEVLMTRIRHKTSRVG
jgi:hypothetical protein